jgi:hypothetical protein
VAGSASSSNAASAAEAGKVGGRVAAGLLEARGAGIRGGPGRGGGALAAEAAR